MANGSGSGTGSGRFQYKYNRRTLVYAAYFWFCAPCTQRAIFYSPKTNFKSKIGENVFESLREGLRFVRKTKVVLSALTLDMIAVLLAVPWLCCPFTRKIF